MSQSSPTSNTLESPDLQSSPADLCGDIVFASNPDGIVLVDLRGRLIGCNTAFERMTGYGRDELLKMTLYDIVHPFDAKENAVRFLEIFQGNTNALQLERRYRRKDGDTIWTNTTAALVRDKMNMPQYIVCMEDDITERRRGNEALKAIAEVTFSAASGTDFFHELVRHLATALGVAHAFVTECANPHMTRVKALAFWMNDHYFEDYEYDLAGTPCEAVIQQEKVAYYPADVQSLFPTDQDLVAIKAQSYVGLPIYDAAGKVIGHLVVMDTKEAIEAEPRGLWILQIFAARAGAELERKRAEQERERLIVELQEANLHMQESSRLKSEFLATMSHELRTPLNAVIGFAGIMLEGMAGEIDDTARTMIKGINDSSEHLLLLINDILDLSKIEAGHLLIAPAPMNIGECVEGWQTQFSAVNNGKDIRFDVEIDAALPNEVVADKERVTQIVTNLLSNAFKFTERGFIKLSLRRDAETMQIVVTDSGIGIAPHAQGFIFDEFRQVDGSTRRSYGGAGLGLAIVRKLCKAMNGSIAVYSKLGEGSTFTVTLPLLTNS